LPRENTAATAPEREMGLPDTEALELSDTLNTILAGIQYHGSPILQRLARTIVALSEARQRSLENLSEEQLRSKLKDMTLELFHTSPRALRAIDQALSELELEIIRKNSF